MRKRDVVGRKIVDVVYHRWHDAEFGHLEACDLVLDNGRHLRAFAFPTIDTPQATIVITDTGRKRKAVERVEGKQ